MSRTGMERGRWEAVLGSCRWVHGIILEGKQGFGMEGLFLGQTLGGYGRGREGRSQQH